MKRTAFVGASVSPFLRRAVQRPQSQSWDAPIAQRFSFRCALPNVSFAAGALPAVEALWHGISGPLFAPLNDCTPTAVRVLVWLNFRAAVLLFVISPLALFAGSITRGHESANDALTRVLAGYWQASALLLCAVLLNAGNVPSAAFMGFLVQVLVPVSLNWWTDLLQEIDNENGSLERLFQVWRPVATGAAAVGAAVQVPFQRCNFLSDMRSDCMCVAWTEPPVRLFEILSSGVDEKLIGALGEIGSAVYLAYLAYYIAFVLPRVGRSGRKKREVFSAVDLLVWLDWIDTAAEGKRKETL